MVKILFDRILLDPHMIYFRKYRVFTVTVSSENLRVYCLCNVWNANSLMPLQGVQKLEWYNIWLVGANQTNIPHM